MLDTFEHGVTDHALNNENQCKLTHVACCMQYAVGCTNCMLWVDHHCKHAIVMYSDNANTVEYLKMFMF